MARSSLVALTLACLALAGCATRPVVSVCPALVTYTAAQQKAAAAELAALPAGSQLGVMFVDYGQLRSEARACQGVSK